MTVEFLEEIDKLVQLIESPIFAGKYLNYLIVLFMGGQKRVWG
jgi:hypothetical protein